MISTSRLFLLCVALTALLLAGCKIRIAVPEGGSVVTESGRYECPAAHVCTIEVSDVYFDETFAARPDKGYRFLGWMTRDKALCGGREDACRLTTTIFPGFESLMAILRSDQVWHLTPLFGCVDDPQDTQTIAGAVGGDELSITVSDRFGGAIDSLRWRGKEFINVWDHGREISYAWSMNNFGECLNPTEPGSAYDYKAPTSTSVMVSACKTSANAVTTVTRPAYWLGPGETGFCHNGAVSAMNTELISDQILNKTVTIGYRGLENVIAFDAVITNANDYKVMLAEIPTAYLTHEFSRFWSFNPQTGQLISPSSGPLTEPWSFVSHGSLPPIIATPDGEYAIGAYYGGPKGIYYSLALYESLNADDQTSKWNIVVKEDPYPAGTYRYQSFVIVGTLDDVRSSMIDLYNIHPTDFTKPQGFLDVVDCNQIAGWSWDPGEPNRPLSVAIYEVDSQGGERLVTTVAANIYRSDLQAALGDNGAHGFSIPTPFQLRDSLPHTIRAYGVNPDPRFPNEALISSNPSAGQQLQCAAM